MEHHCRFCGVGGCNHGTSEKEPSEGESEPFLYLVRGDGMVEAFGFDEKTLPPEIGDIVGKKLKNSITGSESLARLLGGITSVLRRGAWVQYDDTIMFATGKSLRMRVLITPDSDRTVAIYFSRLRGPMDNVVHIEERRFRFERRSTEDYLHH